MDSVYEKIGVINYQKSKYANLFTIGSFVLFIILGVVSIVLSGSVSDNILIFGS